MEHAFKVTMNFIADTIKKIDNSSTSRLPIGQNKVQDITIDEIADGNYRAEILIQAIDLTEAKRKAVSRVEQFLKILAISNDLFAIDLASIDARLIRELNTSHINIQREGNKVSAVIEERIYVTDRLDILKRKGNLNFEIEALATSGEWPEYLRRGIELNYSAARSTTEDIRFLLLTATLEILAWRKLGSPKSLLKSVLAAENYTSFQKSFLQLLEEWKFNEDQKKRLQNHLFSTHNLPVAFHLFEYLQSVGITTYNIEDIQVWWGLRGKLAHGDAVKQEVLNQHLSKVTKAVQDALREEVNRLKLR